MNCNSDISLFRVRKSWDSITSQVGAYFILENAIKMAIKTKSNVYNNKKECVFDYEKEIIL